MDLKAEPSLFHTENAPVERVMKKIQLNLSTTATMGTEESDHCKEVHVIERFQARANV